MIHFPETISCPDTALSILEIPDERLDQLLEVTRRVTEKKFGRRVELCSIVNAGSGRCGEDCSFCGQSRHMTHIPGDPGNVDLAGLMKLRDGPMEGKVSRFSVVTTGRGADDPTVGEISHNIRQSSTDGPQWCASLGIQTEEKLRLLSEAGLVRYHHNIETAESHFPKVCTSHSWSRRMETVLAAKRAGLEICSGGIIGLGESRMQRVEMAFQLRNAGVDSIALNFLIPIPGTPLYGTCSPPSPVDLLKTIAMFRLVCHRSELRICGGRELLGPMEIMMFRAGVTGMMTGPLLTTSGTPLNADLALLEQMKMEPAL